MMRPSNLWRLALGRPSSTNLPRCLRSQPVCCNAAALAAFAGPAGLEVTPEMRSKLVARVWLMLGSTASGVTLRDVRSVPTASLAYGALAPPAAHANATPAPPASQRRRRLRAAEGLADAFPAGSNTDFLQFEAPAGRTPADGGQPDPSISAQSAAENGAPGASTTALQLVFVAASLNPAAAYSQAVATLK